MLYVIMTINIVPNTKGVTAYIQIRKVERRKLFSYVFSWL